MNPKLKKKVKKIFNSFGYKILKSETKNYSSQNPFKTQYNLLPDPNAAITILDVGAYVGEVTHIYNNLFPKSNIYSFEPFPASFQELSNNVKNLTNVSVFNKAITHFTGKSFLNSNSFSQTNSLLNSHPEADKTWNKGLFDTQEKVEVVCETLDDFINNTNIPTVDILKIDVQGGELSVLKGAVKAFGEKKIKMIFTEISIMPSYEGQPFFDEIVNFLRLQNLTLYNLYNYSTTEKGQLRQIDALFVLDELINDKIDSLEKNV